jgi:hypothetical protein
MSAGGGWKTTDLLKRAFSGYCKTKSWPEFELVAFMNWWWGADKWVAWESGWSEAVVDGGWKHGNIAPIRWRLSVIIAREPKFMEIA